MPRKSIFNMGKSTSEIDALASLGQRLIDLVTKFDGERVVVRRRRRHRKEELPTIAIGAGAGASEAGQQLATQPIAKKRRAKRRSKAVARVPRKARKEIVVVDVSPSE